MSAGLSWVGLPLENKGVRWCAQVSGYYCGNGGGAGDFAESKGACGAGTAGRALLRQCRAGACWGPEFDEAAKLSSAAHSCCRQAPAPGSAGAMWVELKPVLALLRATDLRHFRHLRPGCPSALSQ